jgi:hypothetical protein
LHKKKAKTWLLGRNSAVGIATRYGLDGPGSESWWGTGFAASVHTGPGTHPASHGIGIVSFQVVKRPRRGVDHPHPSSAEVKERVVLYGEILGEKSTMYIRVTFVYHIFSIWFWFYFVSLYIWLCVLYIPV